MKKAAWIGRAGMLSIVVLPAATAGAVPFAASVASPPLVAMGVLVGLALLGLSMALFVRTMRSMKRTRAERPIDVLRRNVDTQLEHYRATADRSAVGPMIEALREAETDEERQVLVEALSEMSGRYFGIDVVAWQAWWRRESGASLPASALRTAEPPAGEFLPVS